MANIVDLLIGLGIDADEYSTGVDQAVAKTDTFVGRLTSTVGPAIAGAFAAGGAAVVGFVGTSVSAAADFEASVNNLAAVSGSSLAEAGFSFDDVSAKALELGQTTAYSASQSIAAMTELVKGGVPIVDVMGDATAATLDLAAAGGLELAGAAEIVSKQLGVWADQGVTAADVSNLLAQAANASTVGVEELANGLANAQGTAETAGVEYDDLVQTMALLAPNFASASTAGTSLNNFLLRLQPTTAGATAAMVDLGLATEDGKSKFYDANGAFIGMEAAAGLLQTSLAGLSEAEKTAALSVIFGNDAMGAAVALGAAGAEGFVAMGEAMTAAGTAASVAAIQNQGLNFAFDSMLGAIETLQIIIGTMLLPILTTLINNTIIPGISAVSGFATAISNANIPFGTLFAIMTGGVPTITQTSALISSLASLVGVQLATQIVNAASSFGGIFAAMQPLIGLVSANLMPILAGLATVLGVVLVNMIAGFVASVLTVLAPIALAVGAVAAMYAAYQSNFLGIQNVVNTVVNFISSLVTSVMSTVLSFWQTNGATILSTAQTNWNTIQTAITNVVNAINGVITSVFNVILTFWQNNGNQIMTFAGTTWNSISTIIAGVVQIISTVVTTVFNFIAGFINNHGNQIQNALNTAWQFIEGVVSGTLETIQGIVNLVLGVITGDMETFDAGAKQIFEGLFTVLETVFTSGVDLLQSIFNGGLELIRDLLSAFVGDAEGLGGGIIDGVINGVQSGVGALVDAVQDAAQSALDAAKDLLGISSPSKVAYEEWGKPFMQGPINAIEDMIPALMSVSADAGRAMTESAKSATSPIDFGGDSFGKPGEALGVGAADEALARGGFKQEINIEAHYEKVEKEENLRDTLRQAAITFSPSGAFGVN